MKVKSMKGLVAALAITTMSLPLAGCLGAATSTGRPATSVLANTLKDEKALYVAEAAFKGISLTILEGTKAGLIKGELATKVDVQYRRAYAALQLARTAQRTGNAQSMAEQAGYVVQAVANIGALVNRK